MKGLGFRVMATEKGKGTNLNDERDSANEKLIGLGDWFNEKRIGGRKDAQEMTVKEGGIADRMSDPGRATNREDRKYGRR